MDIESLAGSRFEYGVRRMGPMRRDVSWLAQANAPRDQSPRPGGFPGIFDSRMTPHAVKKRQACSELVASSLVFGRVSPGTPCIWPWAR